MTLEHEYAVVGGYNRSHVGRWLAVMASSISAFTVFLVLSVVDLARTLGWNANLPPMALSLVGAGVVYAALYWAFDRYAWKLKRISDLLKIPDISGNWQCSGVPLDKGNAKPWTSSIKIVQSWDRLRIYSETSQSSSNSIAAAIIHDAAAGYRLMYHYTNSPRIGENELAAHHGFAEFVFSSDLQTARGEYFNGRGRNTYGTMTLTRENFDGEKH